MLRKYTRELKTMTEKTIQDATRYMIERGILPGDAWNYSFLSACLHARLCQADVVLCLLRIGTANAIQTVEALVGRPITHCPPALALRRARIKVRVEVREGDERLIVKIRKPSLFEKGKRRLLNCAVYARLALVRVGMSINQIISRGVKRRDLKIALRRGYLSIESGRA
jgi:hypothetical protein